MAISFFDRQTLSVLAPTVTAQLHISNVDYGWLGTAFATAYLVGAPYAGWLVDRVGARRGMLGAMALWTLVAALHALAPGFAMLVALRVALGLAESPSFPAAVQTVQRSLSVADRARGMSTLFVGMSLGAMLAPPLATALNARWGWRAAFAGTSCVGLLWMPLWLRTAYAARAKALLDAPRGERASRGSLAVIKHPSVTRALLAQIAVTPCSAFALAWEAKFYAHQYALTQEQLWGYVTASAFAYDCGALLFGDLAARRAIAPRQAGSAHDGSPPRVLFGVATLLAAAGFMALAEAPSPRVAVICMVFGAVGRGAMVTLLNTDMAERAPRAAVSAAAGIIASAQAAMHAIVNPIIGHAVERAGYHGILLALGAWTIPGALAWLFWSSPAEPAAEASP
jgi:ACS family hexuronate transporter-like MFS transporter